MKHSGARGFRGWPTFLFLFCVGHILGPCAIARAPASHLPLGRGVPQGETPRPREERGANDTLSTADLLGLSFTTAEARDKVIERIGDLKPPALGRRKLESTAGVAGSDYKVFSHIPANFHVGSTGAGPCVGLILTTPPTNGQRRVFVFHFDAGQRPFSTIEKRGPFPVGTHAAVFGGDASPESNQTLKGVMLFLDREAKAGKIVIDGYAKSAGLWVDRDGGYGTFGIEPWGTRPGVGR